MAVYTVRAEVVMTFDVDTSCFEEFDPDCHEKPKDGNDPKEVHLWLQKNWSNVVEEYTMEAGLPSHELASLKLTKCPQ